MAFDFLLMSCLFYINFFGQTSKNTKSDLKSKEIFLLKLKINNSYYKIYPIFTFLKFKRQSKNFLLFKNY